MSLTQQISEGVNALGLTPPPPAVAQFEQYLQLLGKWNRHFNLTAVRNLDAMVTLHLLDSLSIAPYIKGNSLLDVGTGAGLPGIPLAILFPELTVNLLDSNAKKIRFCRQAVNELGLKNVSAHQARIEDFKCPVPVSQICSRAFTDLPNMVNLMQAYLDEGVQLLAMKGLPPEQEMHQLQRSGYAVESHLLQVPGLNAERHLILISKTD